MSNQDALFVVTTRMDKADYRNFSYLMIFRNKLKTILLMIVLAAAGAGLGAMMDASFTAVKFLITWLILFVTEFIAIFLRVEYKAFTRANQIRAGMNGEKQVIQFYENYLIAAQDNYSGTSKIKYEKLFQVLESNDYYIISASANSASMIRKKDIEEDERNDFREFLKTKMGTRYKSLS